MYRIPSNNEPGIILIETGSHIRKGQAGWDEYRAWVRAGGIPEAPSPTDSLDTLREELRSRISAWRDQQERGRFVFQHAGRNWDGGKATEGRLKPVLKLPALPEGFYWTDADNNKVTGLTLEDLAALDIAHDIAMVSKGWEIHARQTQMKDEVAAAADRGTLLSYKIGWPGDLPTTMELE